MSTEFILYKGKDSELTVDDGPTYFEVAIGSPFYNRDDELDYAEAEVLLTPDEALAAAIKLINVVLYSYPERHADVIEQVRKLRC